MKRAFPWAQDWKKICTNKLSQNTHPRGLLPQVRPCPDRDRFRGTSTGARCPSPPSPTRSLFSASSCAPLPPCPGTASIFRDCFCAPKGTSTSGFCPAWFCPACTGRATVLALEGGINGVLRAVVLAAHVARSLCARARLAVGALRPLQGRHRLG